MLMSKKSPTYPDYTILPMSGRMFRKSWRRDSLRMGRLPF